MNTIAGKIDNWFTGQYTDYCLRVHGLTELIKLSDQPVPTTIKEKKKVAIDDAFDLIFWQRFQKLGAKDSEDDSFGDTTARKQSAKLRLFIAIKNRYGYDWITEFARDFPMSFAVENYRYVYNEIDIDPDHESIYRSEFGDTSYEKHRLTWNLFAVDLTVDFVLCGD